MTKQLTIEKTCNAPCIVNVAKGYYLMSCGAKHGHKGDHFLKSKDQDTGKDVVTTWSYLGDSKPGGISPAGDVRDRCESWAHIQGLPKLAQSEPFGPPNFSCTQSNQTGGFCCEKGKVHEGDHIRSGVFKPLGISWKITW